MDIKGEIANLTVQEQNLFPEYDDVEVVSNLNLNLLQSRAEIIKQQKQDFEEQYRAADFMGKSLMFHQRLVYVEQIKTAEDMAAQLVAARAGQKAAS